MAGVELPVGDLLAGHLECIASVAHAATTAVVRDRTPVIDTSRTYHAGGRQALDQGRRICEALVDVFRRLPPGAAFVVAKSGITSHEIATRGLGIVQAEVRGRLLPGVPVWTGPQRVPPFVVFPEMSATTIPSQTW